MNINEISLSNIHDISELQKLTGDQVIHTFTVLWDGWDSDSVGYILADSEDKIYVLMTNHGTFYRAKKEDLIERLNFYTTVIDETRTALQAIIEEK